MSTIRETVRKQWRELPPPAATAITHAVSVGIGLLCAVAVYYVLYRVALPSKPFIYVSF